MTLENSSTLLDQLVDTSSISPSHLSVIDSIVGRVQLLCNQVANDPLANATVIESDPMFITSKKTLLSLSNITSLIPYVIYSFIDLLDDLNKKDHYSYIKKRSDQSLNQIFIVLSLFSDFTEANWRLKEKSELTSLSSRSTNDSDKDFPHRIPPDPLEQNLVMHSLNVLVKLKSFKKSRSIIRQLDGNAGYFELTSSNQVIADIDYDVDALCRYLGAACPKGYSKTTEIAVNRNSDINNNDILGYLEYLAFLNLSTQSFEKEFSLLVYFTDFFKNSYIQHIHSSFFIEAVINYSVCYTKDFLEVISRSSVNKVGDVLFEKVYQKFKISSLEIEPKKNSSSTQSPSSTSNQSPSPLVNDYKKVYEKKFFFKSFAIALIVNPRHFETFLASTDTSSTTILNANGSGSNKQKLLKAATSSNRKQKLLQHVVKNIYDGSDKVPTLEFFLMIFNVASVIIQFDPNHPVVNFAKSHVLQTYNVLCPTNNPSLMLDCDIAAIDKIRVQFYSFAMVLAPELIKPKVITIIANPDTSLQYYYIITHAIQDLVKRPYHHEFAYKLIETIAITLRDHTGKLAKIVHETVADYENIISDNSSSSASFKYNNGSISDSRTMLASKYSSVTLSGTPPVSSSSVSGGLTSYPENIDGVGLPLGAINTEGSNGNNHDYFTGSHIKRSRKESFFSALSKRTSSTAKLGFSKDKHKDYEEVDNHLNDRVSIQSFSLSHSGMKNKPISALNQEYMKRVENTGFLAREILKLVFSIFRNYSGFFFKLPAIFDVNSNHKSSEGFDKRSINLMAIRETQIILKELKRILDPLLISLADSDAKLVEKARRLIVKIMDVDDGTLAENYIALFSSLYLQSGFVDISLTMSLNDVKFLDVMSFITMFWAKRGIITARIDRNALFPSIGPEGVALPAELVYKGEKLLFVSMATPGIDYHRILKINCNYYYTELRLSGNFLDELRSSVNYDLFEDIANDNFFVTSGNALQKRFRRQLSKFITVYSPGLMDAMEIMYERWKEYYIIRSPTASVEQEHRNYGGILAVLLGGISNSKIINYEIAQTRLNDLNKFLSRQIQHLTSSNVLEREAAKELIAYELHPSSHKIVINIIQKDLNTMLQRKEKFQNQVNINAIVINPDEPLEYLPSRELTLLESYISILTGFLNCEDIEVNFSSGADLKSIALKLVTLLKPVSARVEDFTKYSGVENIQSVRLKIKVCRFFQKFTYSSDIMGIRGFAVKWRNEMIANIIRWLDLVCFGADSENNLFELHNSNTSSMINGSTKLSSRTEMKSFIYFELALDCLKAISGLFKETPIYPFGAQYSEEINTVKKAIFVNYFNLFSRILESCLERSNTKNKNSGTLSAVDRKIELMKDEVIVCLSNMLEFNYGVGIDLALPLAFHSDLKVKYSSSLVLNNIIESIQTAKSKNTPEFESVAFIRFANHFSHCSDFLIAVSNSILSTEFDTFSQSLLQLLISVNREVPKITDLVDYEIEISSPNKVIDCLRRTSVPAKMLSLYGKHAGFDYLQSILQPTFDELHKKKDWFEVEKLQKDNDLIIEENITRFFNYLNKIVDSVSNSVESMPLELKVLCANIRKLVKKKTNDDKVALLVISSFLFLRFVCPAIVNPESEGLVNYNDVVIKEEKRSYIQLAKVIQNLANDSLSSIRWPLLTDEKTRLNGLKNKLFKFLDEVSKPNFVEELVPPKSKTFITKKVFTVLYSLLVHRNSEFSLNLIHPNHQPKNNVTDLIDDMSALEDISINIGEKYLKFSPVIPDYVRNNKEKFADTYDLFNRYQDVYDPEIVKCPFVTQSYMRDGTLVVSFSERSFKDIIHKDTDLIVYRTLQVCNREENEPFNVILDYSFYEDKDRYLFNKYFEGLFKYAPTFWKDCLTIYYYGINPEFYPFLEQMFITRIQSGGDYNDTGYFYSPFDNIGTLETVGIPKISLNILKDTQTTIDCLIYSEELEKYVPVVIKIGKLYVFWSYQVKKLRVNDKEHTVRLTETSKVSDWVDAMDCDFINNDGNEFKVMVRNHGLLRFSSTKKKEILRSFYLARLSTTYINEAETDYYLNHIVLKSPHSPDTFLGSMIASILLNLISTADDIRNSALHSLKLIINFHQLKVSKNIVADGANFPKDFIPYVLEIAEDLSNNHPELTSDFITALTDAYETSESKYCCLMILSLWIKNIYQQIYVNKKDKIAAQRDLDEIVNKFIKQIPPADDDLLLTYKAFIWTGLISDSNLATLAITDIMQEALRCEVENKDWGNICAAVSFCPTPVVSDWIINEAVEVVNIPAYTTDRQVSLNITWLRAKIVIKICELLAFDSLSIANRHYPEICFVVSMLINIGSHELRVSSRNLIINVLHSFLSKPDLSVNAKNHIRKTIDDFAGSGSKITFGLSKSINDPFMVLSERHDQILGAYVHIRNFCLALLKVIELQPTKKEWRQRWLNLALSSAVKHNTPLQGRGILVSSVLVGEDFVEGTISNFLIKYKLWSEGLSIGGSMITGTCFQLGFTHLINNLPINSIYWGAIYWIGISELITPNSVVYQSGLITIRDLLKRMIKVGLVNENVGILDIIKETRQDCFDYSKGIEKLIGSSFDSEYADNIFNVLAMRGLCVPYLKKAAYEFVCIFAEHRLNYEFNRDNFFNENSAISYLAIAFVTRNHEEDYLNLINSIDGLKNLEMISTNYEVEVPKILIEFFASENDHAIITLHLLSCFFSTDLSDPISKLRFLSLINSLNEYSPDLVLYFYLVNYEGLIREIEVSGTVNSLEATYDLITFAGLHPNFEHPEVVKDKFDKVFKRFGIGELKLNEVVKKIVSKLPQVEGVLKSPFRDILHTFLEEQSNKYTDK